jgi:hypothetical protein
LPFCPEHLELSEMNIPRDFSHEENIYDIPIHPAIYQLGFALMNVRQSPQFFPASILEISHTFPDDILNLGHNWLASIGKPWFIDVS